MNKKETNFSNKTQKHDPMKRHKINMLKPFVFSTFLAVVVTGCMVGPNLEKPVYETADQFRFDSIANDSMITKYDVYIVLMNGVVIPAIIEPQSYK